MIHKAILLCVAVATCAWPQQTASQPGGLWINVPFIKQPQEGCGAASIAMVMKYWQGRQGKPDGEASNVALIQQTLFSDQAHGIYASDLQRYLDMHGFQTQVFHGDQALLQHHIASGRPLIVALKPTSGLLLHYLVVAGVDREQHVVLVNDPAQRKLFKMDSGNFEKEWQATRNWTLLALPTSEAH